MLPEGGVLGFGDLELDPMGEDWFLHGVATPVILTTHERHMALGLLLLASQRATKAAC